MCNCLRDQEISVFCQFPVLFFCYILLLYTATLDPIGSAGLYSLCKLTHCLQSYIPNFSCSIYKPAVLEITEKFNSGESWF